MVLAKIPEQINYEFEADREHAQILIEMTDPVKCFEEVRGIIEGLGVYITETKRLSTNWIVIKLNVKDMREVMLRLTEVGFLHIKGINATQFA